MHRAIGLLVLGFGLVFPPAARAGVIVQTSLSLTQLQINPSFGVVQILSPFSASAYVTGEDSLSGFGTCPQASQVNDGSTSITCASALASASGSASSMSDTTSLLAASAASSVNIGGVTASASSTGQGGLGGDFGGTGLFEIYDASNASPSNVNVTFAAELSGNQSLTTDAYGQFATSEIIFNLFLPDIGTTVLSLDNPLSIGPSTSFAAPYSNTLTGTVTLQTNTDYTLIAEGDAETSGLNLTPEPSSFFLTALGLFAVLYAGWRINGNRASRHKLGAC
jgi:hypothetical protein